ncbi:peptidyl-prolyl cis-trans isomerase Pin1-like, partial [Phalaenopsis equestris]|uniref:peptidyl-prolyl cis-trans isomerase Pin1-like n=1 Tax=Phalaenopsis equestris TaxID=78828 RepID=UPI0009E50744
MPEGEVTERRMENGKRKRERNTAAAVSAAGIERIRASHILLKHEESRRKSSWKDPEGRLISITTKAKAAEQLRELREEVAAGRSLFEDVAARPSHCSSAIRGGGFG